MVEPGGALVVEVGQRAALQHALGVLVDGELARGRRWRRVGLLAHEPSRFGVTVNAIQPGRIASRGFPELEGDARRGVQFVSAEPAGRLAVWLTSDEAAEITGETIDAQAWDAERQAR